MLSGPFDTTYGFVSHIALPNCVDYFRAMTRREESGNTTVADHFNELRLLFNAAISLNHALEWRFYEIDEPVTLDEFRKKLESESPALGEIRAFANAGKHRFRGKPKGGRYPRKLATPHARDTVEKSMEVDVQVFDDKVGVGLTFEFDLSRFHVALEEGFRYWVDWQNVER